MQKILLILFIVSAFFAKAQKKLTNENILGRWQVYSLKIEGFAFYDTEKDSLSFLEKMAEKVKTTEDSLKMADEFKKEFGEIIKTTSLNFKKGGKVECTILQEKFDGTYEMNEFKKTLVIKSDRRGTIGYLIDLRDDRLLLTELGIDTMTFGLKKP